MVIIAFVILCAIYLIFLFLLKKFLINFNKKINITYYFLLFFLLTSISALFLKIYQNTQTELLHNFSTWTLFLLFSISFIGIISIFISLFYIKIFSFKKKDNINKNKELTVKAKNTMSRREFLKKSSLIFPILASSTSVYGLIEASRKDIINKINLYYDNLDKEFNGLKIAHISDLHLGSFIRVRHLKYIIENLNKENIDLLLITGDFVDDYNLLDDSLRELKKIKTKYGIFSSAGNHEYFRGIKPVLNKFKEYSIPYLINSNIRIKINNKYISILGIDDPQKLSGEMDLFLERSMKKSLINSDAHFKIAMSHRPNVFKYSIKNNIDLTLSGHTHGAQIGFAKRSIFEYFTKDKFFWGHYKKANSQLYTSSGAGHWFPIRINCPNEVPVFTLKKKI